MRWRVMPSSVIRAFDYDADRRRLTITFQTGRRYVYLDVPEEVAAELQRAPSRGVFFKAMIRDSFPAERVRGAA
jgi:YD repeat-containing protein